VADRFHAALTTEPAKAYQLMRQAEHIVAELRAEIRAHAERSPIPIGDGYVYGLHEREVDVLDPTVVRRVLTETHPPAVADAAITQRTSKAAIEDALRTVAPKGALAGQVRDALKGIRSADGIRTARQTRCEEFKRPKQRLGATR